MLAVDLRMVQWTYGFATLTPARSLPSTEGLMVEESRYFSSSGPLPGHILALIISTITGEAPCHECSSRIETMNENGWLWCWRNRTLIAKWLVDEAAKRGHKIGHNKALALILAAFRTVMSDKKALTRHLADLKRRGMSIFIVRKV